MTDTKSYTTMNAGSVTSDATKNTKQSKQSKKAGADDIWDEISSLPLSIFALPNQKVSDHFTKVDIPSPDLYVKPKSAAAIPALEEAIGSGFSFETTEQGSLIVKRVSKSLA